MKLRFKACEVICRLRFNLAQFRVDCLIAFTRAQAHTNIHITRLIKRVVVVMLGGCSVGRWLREVGGSWKQRTQARMSFCKFLLYEQI
ncbi:hypothetical protein M0802_009549 [Mischocyttarus mexicanus]|nr:hypothetical protein M0802_009549 [Mischocyttarus mexicanus]